MLGYFSADREANSFPRAYILAVLFIILQIFVATRAVLKIGEYHLDIPHFFFSHVTRLDQSSASENI